MHSHEAPASDGPRAHLLTISKLHATTHAMGRSCMEPTMQTNLHRPHAVARIRPGMQETYDQLHALNGRLDGLKGALYATDPDFVRPVVRHAHAVSTTEEVAETLQSFRALLLKYKREIGLMAQYLGVSVPDLPPEEANRWARIAAALPVPKAGRSFV